MASNGLSPVFKGEGGGGWEAIPGGHHNGQRKRGPGGQWVYRYNHEASHEDHLHSVDGLYHRMRQALSHGVGGVDHEKMPEPGDVRAHLAAVAHHGSRARGREKKQIVDRVREVRDIARDVANKNESRRSKGHEDADYGHTLTARAVRDAADNALRAMRPKKEQTFTQAVRDTLEDNKQAKEDEAVPLPDAAPKGKHYIAQAAGDKVPVDTISTHGLYAVHGGPVTTATRGRGGAVSRYTVTHTPTGMAVGHFGSLSGAKGAAKHFHQHAGDAGSDAKFGTQPAGEAWDKLIAAHRAMPSTFKSEAIGDFDLRKSMIEGRGGIRKSQALAALRGLVVKSVEIGDDAATQRWSHAIAVVETGGQLSPQDFAVIRQTIAG